MRQKEKSAPEELLIRPERFWDVELIGGVHRQAFGQECEAQLVESLRTDIRFVPGLSLVALAKEEVVGHVLFFPITLGQPVSDDRLLSLAPVAVLPAWQGLGIGSRLIREGISLAARLGFHGIVVLGHPAYYPRFGFCPASRFGISAPFDAPDEAFMALELRPETLRPGALQYPAPFFTCL